MAPTMFIKFCGFILHSNPNNMALSAFPGKNPCNFNNIFFLIFYRSPKVAPKLTDQTHSHSISRVPLQISSACSFRFRATPKIKGSSHKKKI